MNDSLEARRAGPGVEIHGPFRPEHRVSLDSYQVPYVTASVEEDGSVDISIDRRFSMEGPVSREEFDRWIPILANAMAVAAGYPCHGATTKFSPFAVRMTSLGSINPKPRLTVMDGGESNGGQSPGE